MTEHAKETPAIEAEQHSVGWRWWKSLDESDRAGRSELRRCGTTAEVAFTAAYHRLLRRVAWRRGNVDARWVAAIAAVLAHVEEEPPEDVTFARMMGTPKGDAHAAPVADTRFRQLLRSEDPDELLRGLVRIVRQLGRRAPVEQLLCDLMRWNERTRTRWAYDYYDAAPMAKKTKKD